MFNITKYHQSDCISTFYHQQFMRIIIVPYPFQQADFFIRHFYSFQSCRSEMIIFFHHHTLTVKLMMVSLLDETVNLIILLCDKREGCINHFCCILKYDGCPEEKQYMCFFELCAELASFFMECHFYLKEDWRTMSFFKLGYLKINKVTLSLQRKQLIKFKAVINFQLSSKN